MCTCKSNYIQKAIAIANSCLNDPRRSPFGSIIVQNDKIIGEGKEATKVNNDPTAHSEIQAIRNACKHLNTSNLKGCVMYTSSEPCSMCLSAIFWAKIDMVYYACSREDVYQFGLPDRFMLVEKRENQITQDFKKLKMHQITNDNAKQVFYDWRKLKASR